MSLLTFNLLLILIHRLTGGVGMFLQMFSSSAVQVTVQVFLRAWLKHSRAGVHAKIMLARTPSRRENCFVPSFWAQQQQQQWDFCLNEAESVILRVVNAAG